VEFGLYIIHYVNSSAVVFVVVSVVVGGLLLAVVSAKQKRYYAYKANCAAYQLCPPTGRRASLSCCVLLFLLLVCCSGIAFYKSSVVLLFWLHKSAVSEDTHPQSPHHLTLHQIPLGLQTPQSCSPDSPEPPLPLHCRVQCAHLLERGVQCPRPEAPLPKSPGAPSRCCRSLLTLIPRSACMSLTLSVFSEDQINNISTEYDGNFSLLRDMSSLHNVHLIKSN
jgi:hypothetical protein